VVLVGAALTLAFWLGAGTPSATCSSDRRGQKSRKLAYGFESGSEGWTVRAVAGSRAFRQAKASNEQAKQDKGSLRLDTELVAGDTEKSQGEAFVKLSAPRT